MCNTDVKGLRNYIQDYNCFSIQKQNLNVSAQIVIVGMISPVRFKIESYVEIDDININTILG